MLILCYQALSLVGHVSTHSWRRWSCMEEVASTAKILKLFWDLSLNNETYHWLVKRRLYESPYAMEWSPAHAPAVLTFALSGSVATAENMEASMIMRSNEFELSALVSNDSQVNFQTTHVSTVLWGYAVACVSGLQIRCPIEQVRNSLTWPISGVSVQFTAHHMKYFSRNFDVSWPVLHVLTSRASV